MVTINEEKLKKVKGDSQYILVELSCLSTDSKPTEINDCIIENGSTCIEIDTGKIYFYDLENEQWNEA